MTRMEQIVTIKVTYDDNEANRCPAPSEISCCGVGNCSKVKKAPSESVMLTMNCCFKPQNITVINQSPVYEVVDKDSFA